MIVPSVDIMGGKVVQLTQGKRKVIEEDDVEARLKRFSVYGEVALIDLDAAMGQGSNADLIMSLVAKYPARVGGGIRDVETARDFIKAGAERVIVGSRAFSGGTPDLGFLSELRDAIGRESLMVALDSLGGQVAVKGWKETLPIKAVDAGVAIADYVGGFLLTCVDREGLMGGTDHEALKEFRASLGKHGERLRLVAAGGISKVEEMRQLGQLGFDLQLGMAIYTQAVPVEEAFIASVDFSKGLVPTIARDRSGQVLMLAFSNEESLRKTFAGGLATYYSRSRSSLWTKGETSGNYQKLVQARIDCDNDSILLTVDSQGPACHTESYSCFGPREFSLGELYAVVEDRFRNPQPGSYTSTLDTKRIRRKLNEECYELIEAESDEDVVAESADLLYFFVAYLAKRGIGLDAVWNELRKRRRR